jgi:ABC-type multidrug transport system ATPase subunit
MISVQQDDPGLVLANIVSFVGQLDNHAPFLTVRETFEFAFQCRTGGKHAHFGCDGSSTAINLDKENFTENMTIEGLDLAQCADTFVGDANIRGVSGGQRRRVTIGEMMQGQNPVACGDEISTGLDAAVTYDIVHSIVAFAKAAQTTRIVSLLQPGPETFALFDEVILLSEGNIIYAGPIDEVVDYFSALGYEQPPTMDVADFLQSIPTPDGSLMFDPSKSPADAHMGTEEFVEAFKASAQYASIMGQLNSSSPYQWAPAHRNDKGQEGDEEIGKAGGKTAKQIPEEFKSLFQNSFVRAMKLNLHRHYTLWKRDWGFIIGKMFENIGMAFATGKLHNIVWCPQFLIQP